MTIFSGRFFPSWRSGDSLRSFQDVQINRMRPRIQRNFRGICSKPPLHPSEHIHCECRRICFSRWMERNCQFPRNILSFGRNTGWGRWPRNRRRVSSRSRRTLSSAPGYNRLRDVEILSCRFFLRSSSSDFRPPRVSCETHSFIIIETGKHHDDGHVMDKNRISQVDYLKVGGVTSVCR